jgi:putative transposase
VRGAPYAGGRSAEATRRGADLGVKKKRRATGITRQRSLRIVQWDENLLPHIQTLKAEHPIWGYRRMWASWCFVAQLPVNTKQMLRLMWVHHLLVPPNLRLKAKRAPTRSKPRPTKPDEWWGIDMTKVLVRGLGWVCIAVILDWYAQKVAGYYAGLQCTARHWLAALDMAVNRQFPNGARDQALCLMSDNGCQPTSITLMRACRTLGIHQALTSYGNPKGHADTERLIRTLEEECLWLQEWTCPFQLMSAFTDWIDHYHKPYLHSMLGYQSPDQIEQHHLNRRRLPPAWA